MRAFQTSRRNALFRGGFENTPLSGGKAAFGGLRESATAKRGSEKLLKMEETH